MAHAQPLRRVLCTVSLLPILLVAGCYVKVDKSKSGDNKDVEVHLPMGELSVQQNATSAQSIGLPDYPGATVISDKDGGHSANVHVGFGNWQLHLSLAKYQSPDPEAKIDSFYRSALAQYGQVLECRNGHPVGGSVVTREGLGCEDKHTEGKGINISDDEMEYNLRAGSKRHQHIVDLASQPGGGTKFALVRLDLPADLDLGRQEQSQ